MKWTFLAALLGGAIWVVNLIWFRPFSIDWFFDKVFVEFAWNKPQLLSSLGVDFFNDELNDSSPEAEEKDIALLKKDYEQLLEYDRDSLSDQQKLSYDILAFYLQDEIKGLEYRYHGYEMTQRGGAYQGIINFMSSVHDIEDKGDAEDYLSRVSQIGTLFDHSIDSVKKQQSMGVVPPAFVITKILENLHNIRDPDVVDSPLAKDFFEKVDALEGLDDDSKGMLKAQMITHMEQIVNPAYDRLLETFENLQDVATNDAGIWKLPDGDKYYQYRIKSMTTTDYTAEELHKLGLEEVDRIVSEMGSILASEGYVGKSVGEFMQDLNKEERFLYPDTDEAREQILEEYRRIITEADARMDEMFDVRPKSAVEVRRVPTYREKTAAGGSYQAPSPDGERPGIFYANLYDIKATPKYSMRTLAYHEAVPGHHFQIAIKTELEGLPMFRNFIGFTSYSEGWALYAERLAWEYGFHEDPYDNLGRLQDELLRAVRLVVDTGIHHKRWSREQAIDYMASTTGMAQSNVVSEIERYIVWPGQALAYKVGMLKIMELREKAKRELGDRYDIRKFHNVVLKNGAVPLTILEELVEDYIAQEKSN